MLLYHYQIDSSSRGRGETVELTGAWPVAALPPVGGPRPPGQERVAAGCRNCAGEVSCCSRSHPGTANRERRQDTGLGGPLSHHLAVASH